MHKGEQEYFISFAALDISVGSIFVYYLNPVSRKAYQKFVGCPHVAIIERPTKSRSLERCLKFFQEAYLEATEQEVHETASVGDSVHVHNAMFI